ncbi:MAG: 50S ribosomal protein L1 [Candidatus Aenigmarchaeota archaeon]|nr:50S ribosomal protein L1 [Candidatus Aenigmarchaeota archaeon]
MTILEQIKNLKENSKKRNFNQTYDLIINLKDLDLKKAENKIDEIIILPKKLNKEKKITIFTDSIKKSEDFNIISSSKIESISKNKKEISELISKSDFFFAEPKLMPIVGKFLGKYLAPRGLMPKPLVGPLESYKKYKNAVKIKVDKQPVIHTVVGSQDMKDEDVEKNIEFLINTLKVKLPKGKNNIKEVLLKFTMSKPIKLEVK